MAKHAQTSTDVSSPHVSKGLSVRTANESDQIPRPLSPRLRDSAGSVLKYKERVSSPPCR